MDNRITLKRLVNLHGKLGNIELKGILKHINYKVDYVFDGAKSVYRYRTVEAFLKDIKKYGVSEGDVILIDDNEQTKPMINALVKEYPHTRIISYECQTR